MLAIYCRISREKKEGKDLSINEQKLMGIELAKKLNIPYRVFIDEGVSGTLPIEKRPAFYEIKKEIENKLITHLYVYDQSRLERNLDTRLIINKILKDYNVKLYTESGEVDLANKQVRLFGNLVSSFNSYFVEETQDKIKAVLKRRVIEGKAHSSILPYGFRKGELGQLAIDEEEAKIIKEIFDSSLKGIGTNKIAEKLNEKGVLTRYNKIGKGTIKTVNKYTKEVTTTRKKDINWAGNTIRGIIKNPLYKGERIYSGEVYKAPIIIDPIYWQKVNDNLKNNRNNSGKKVEYKYLLKGKLICGKCGRNYYGRIQKGKHPSYMKANYYTCSSKRIKTENCGNRSISIPVLEGLIWNRFFIDKKMKSLIENYFISNNTEEKLNKYRSNLSHLFKEIEKNTERRKKAVNLAIDGFLAKSDIKPELKKIDAEKNELLIKKEKLENQIFFLENENIKVKEFSKDFNKLKTNTPFNDKKALIDKYIKSIKVYYNELSKSYYLIINFNIEEMKSEVVIVDVQYNFAYELNTSYFIPLSEKFKNLSEEELNELHKIASITNYLTTKVFEEIENSPNTLE